jgi:hypothetical protein
MPLPTHHHLLQGATQEPSLILTTCRGCSLPMPGTSNRGAQGIMAGSCQRRRVAAAAHATAARSGRDHLHLGRRYRPRVEQGSEVVILRGGGFGRRS